MAKRGENDGEGFLRKIRAKEAWIFSGNEVKLAGKPGSVVDSHSSRRTVARTLKQPTRRLSEQLHSLPIWSCSGWRLPRFTVT